MTNKRRQLLRARLYALKGLLPDPRAFDEDALSDTELEDMHAKLMAIPGLARLLPPLEPEH